jgi:hypothetical protein
VGFAAAGAVVAAAAGVVVVVVVVVAAAAAAAAAVALTVVNPIKIVPTIICLINMLYDFIHFSLLVEQ